MEDFLKELKQEFETLSIEELQKIWATDSKEDPIGITIEELYKEFKSFEVFAKSVKILDIDQQKKFNFSTPNPTTNRVILF